MNKISKYLYGLMVIPFLALSACGEEEEHLAGEPDLADCQGVYFPTQQVGGTFDPSSDVLRFDVKIDRKNEKGAITVPLEIIGDDKEYFDIPSSVQFADGQAETTFSVSFDKAPLGQECSFTIQVTGPQFVQQYSSNASYISASVVVEKWDNIGKARFREDMMTTFFKLENVEYEVDVLENANQKGYYRLVYPYDAKYPYNEPGDYDESKTYYFEIHAENPNAVWIPVQSTGMAWGDYGMVYIGSEAGYQIVNKGESVDNLGSDLLGTLSNGVITIPAGKMLIAMMNYNNGGLYYANNSGMFRVCLPGAVLTDYSLEVETGYSSDGVIPVYFKSGADIASIKYAAYVGSLDAGAVATAAAAIASGEDKSAVSLDMTQMAAGMKLDASGVYTVVAVGFDESGASQASVHSSFNYVAAGDEEDNAVVMTAGVEKTDRYEGMGYNQTNSIGFYIYGKSLLSVRMGLFSAASLEKNGIDALVAACESVSADDLESVNSSVYMDFYGNLSPNTDYVFVVWGTNGYLEKTLVEEFTTEGLPLELVGTGAYTHAVMYDNPITVPYDLYRDPNVANTYVIDDWWFGSRFKFQWDGKDKVEVATQFSGYSSSYGDVYLVDGANFFKDPTADQLSKYDAETKTWSFYIAYAVPGVGSFGHGYETFTLGGEASANVESSASQPSVMSLKGNEVFSFKPQIKEGVLTGLTFEMSASPASFETVNVERESSGNFKSMRIDSLMMAH